MITFSKLGLLFFFLPFLLGGFAQTVFGQATTAPTLRLITNNPNPQMGDNITLQVFLESVPTIYGADIQLTFDPAIWQVIDEDTTKTGVQAAHGGFIKPGKAFILQHQADNEVGVIDYAITLINPAPPIQGSGLLLQVQLQALTEAISQITVTEALLGTQTGDTIALNTEDLEIIVGHVLSEVITPSSKSIESDQMIPTDKFDWQNLPITILVIALLIMGIRQLAGRKAR